MAGIKGQRRRLVYNTARQKAWQAIRILGRFTIHQVVATTGLTYANAHRYVSSLHKAGFLVRARERLAGQSGHSDLFRLARNPGPSAPLLWRNGQVYDPNTGKVYEDGDEVDPIEPCGAF